MASETPELDPYLDDEDEKLLEDVASPEQGVGGPVPDDLAEIAPDAAITTTAAAPIDDTAIGAVEGPEPPPAALPPDPVATAAGAPMDAAQAVTARTKEAEQLQRRQGALDAERAKINATTAGRIADDARVADEDARLERADYLARRQAAEQDLDARIKHFEQNKEIKAPRNTFKSKLSVIFGGLGAAFRSAGGGDSRNTALANLHKQWENETDIQKANIAAARDSVIQARTRLTDIDEGRRNMMRDADARLVAKYNMALRQGEAQLKNRGVPQAQIDADARILKTREGRDVALARLRQQDDAHALNTARIETEKARAQRLQAQAARDNRRGTGRGGPSAKEKRAQEKHDAFMADRAAKGEKAVDETTVFIGTDRKPAHAPSKKSAEDYRVFESSAQQVEGALERLEQNYKEYGVEISSVLPDLLKSNAARERAAIMESIVLPAKEVGRLGALAGPDKDILINITGGKQAQLLGDEVGIRNIRGWMQRARTGALNSLGIDPTTSGADIKLDGPPSAPPPGPMGGTPAKAAARPAAPKPTAAQDAEAIAWAKKNLADPRARAILQANGAR